jgi:predicted membrane chloride channel (bestrophin family)
MAAKGHTFMSMMVSFLIVTRSNIAYKRFMESRSGVTHLLRASRELMQHAVTFTRVDDSDGAQKWRGYLARRTIVLLRTVVEVLEFPSHKNHAWKIYELSQKEKNAILNTVGYDNERAPFILAMFLRSSIASHAQYLEMDLYVIRTKLPPSVMNANFLICFPSQACKQGVEIVRIRH